MRIEAERKLFVGLKVDNKLRDQLQNAAPKDRVFFDGSDERYLVVVRTDGEEEATYIGKLIEPGTPATSMDDLKRNLQSILNRIAPGRIREDGIKVFAISQQDGPAGVAALARPGRDDDDGAAPSGGNYERRY